MNTRHSPLEPHRAPVALDELARLEQPADTTSCEEFECMTFRREVRLILSALRERMPYIYAVFRKSPEEDFHIALDEDVEDTDRFEEFSIDRFCARYGSFGPKDCIFSLNLMTYSTEAERRELYATTSVLECSPDGLSLYTVEATDPEAAVEEIAGEFPHFMLHLCRKALLMNRPLTIDAATIAGYGFSEADAAVMTRLVARCNETLVGELRGRYEQLKTLDCVKR